MSRADLLALTPETLATLANMGLVKRAQRELAEGGTPELREEEDGTVVGTFKDGIVARLPPGKPLKDAPCTCGATSVCRHRIGVALAYKTWKVAPEVAGAGAPPFPAPEAWSPAEIDDATLERTLGARGLERARALLKKGLLATVERDGVPTAKLPSCTVRFLVPRDIAYARCDCASGGGCEHLALAVWAFRGAKAATPSEVVALGGGAAAPLRTEALQDAMALAREIVTSGVSQRMPSPARFAALRTHLEREGMTWLLGIALDLEMALEGYHKRSALYGTREITALLVELVARVRAGLANGAELPCRFVVGEDEAPETLLDHVRLVSLGARIRADGRTRFADVYLGDADTALVLVLRKQWDFAEDAKLEDGPELARRPVAARIPLRAIAHGQVVSKVVKRRANRSLELGVSRAAQTSVTPQRDALGTLPSPILVRDLAEHEEHVRTRPPRLLRPRVLAEEVHVVEVSAVDHVAYCSAEQELVADLRDAAGNSFAVVARHRSAAPNASDAVARALSGKVRFIAGDLRRRRGVWELDPLALSGDELVVPDLAERSDAPAAAAALPRRVEDPLETAMTRAESSLEELCNTGLGSPCRTLLSRMVAAAEGLDDVGLSGLAIRLRTLEGRSRAGAPAAAADAWLDAALRMALAREAML